MPYATKYSADQERDEHGRFAGGNGAVPFMNFSKMEQVSKLGNDNHGFYSPDGKMYNIPSGEHSVALGITNNDYGPFDSRFEAAQRAGWVRIVTFGNQIALDGRQPKTLRDAGTHQIRGLNLDEQRTTQISVYNRGMTDAEKGDWHGNVRQWIMEGKPTDNTIGPKSFASERKLWRRLFRRKAKDFTDDPAFFAAMFKRLRKTLDPLLVDLFMEGAQIAVKGATPGTGQKARPKKAVPLEPDLTNLEQVAGDAIQAYSDDFYAGLASTTQQALKDAVLTARENGLGVEYVLNVADNLFGPARAQTIAITETTRLMGLGAQATYKASGITQWEWHTAEDDAVDDECANLDGQSFDMSEDFEPAHPNCRCWPAPISDEEKALGAKYSPDQDRDEHGRFAGAGGVNLSDNQANNLTTALAKHGGFSYQPVSKRAPTTGNMVSMPGNERIIEGKVTAQQLRQYLADHKAVLTKPDNFVGAWADDGKVYLDVSTVTQSEAEARTLAIANKQEAYYNVERQESVYVHARGKGWQAAFGFNPFRRDRRGTGAGSGDPEWGTSSQYAGSQVVVLPYPFGNKYSPDQPRDDHGRFADEGGDSVNDVVTTVGGVTTVKTTSVYSAAQALAEGKKVILTQPEDVSTLLDKLARNAREAKRLGEKAPKYNLCDVSVPGTNLFCADNKGYARVDMPQLTGTPTPGSPADLFPRNSRGDVNLSEAFAHHLTTLGVKVIDGTADAKMLRATQKELDGVAVGQLMNVIERGGYDKTMKLWTSKDNYVIDGHHRWAATVGAEYGTGKQVTIPTKVVDMSITDVLAEANKWTRSMGLGGTNFGQHMTVKTR